MPMPMPLLGSDLIKLMTVNNILWNEPNSECPNAKNDFAICQEIN